MGIGDPSYAEPIFLSVARASVRARRRRGRRGTARAMDFPSRRARDVRASGASGAGNVEKNQPRVDARVEATRARVEERYVIPPEHAVGLTWSALLPSVPGCVAARRALTDDRALVMCGLAVCLMACSVAHWRAPRWRAMTRWMDLLAVGACAWYGCATAMDMPWERARVWWIGLSIALCAWLVNHATLARARRRWARESATAEAEKTRTWRRLALTHMVGVHFMSSVSATWLACGL